MAGTLDQAVTVTLFFSNQLWSRSLGLFFSLARPHDRLRDSELHHGPVLFAVVIPGLDGGLCDARLPRRLPGETGGPRQPMRNPLQLSTAGFWMLFAKNDNFGVLEGACDLANRTRADWLFPPTPSPTPTPGFTEMQTLASLFKAGAGGRRLSNAW